MSLQLTIARDVAEKQLLPSIFALAEAHADGDIRITADPPLPDEDAGDAADAG